MKNKLTSLAEKYPFLKWMTNRFVLVTLFFLVWLIFFDTYSFFDHNEIDKEIEKLKANKNYYSSEIKQDEEKIKQLRRAEEVEKYAREKYYMKRENEDIYIIDTAADSVSKTVEK